QKMQYYAEFPNLCFVDTLDNIGALAFVGKQHDMFGVTSENTERIKRQNSKKISVFIGNPPYNANQKNENENNKNREYPFIDKRIKDTFIKYSTAQKTKAYDMYSRFYRWVMDRLDRNGVLAFITNRSFIDSRTFDGFRKSIQDDFSNCYIIDTKSDVRSNPKITGTTHNVFGIQTGVAIMFLIKKEKKEGRCFIEYVSMKDEWRKEEKLDWLKNNPIEKIHFESIHPDMTNNWINLSDDNDWADLIALEKVFELTCNSVKTNRDEWVYDFSTLNQEEKAKYIITAYNKQIKSGKIANTELDYSIKWSRDLKNKLKQKRKIGFAKEKIIYAQWRPFVKKFFYSEKVLNDVLTDKHFQIWGNKLNKSNIVISLTDGRSNRDFHLLSTSFLNDYHYTGDTILAPLYCFDKSENRLDNVTNWGLKQFVNHFQDDSIRKVDIFHYTYAVLHNPAYRKKYKLNLKREFPRLPFYENFWQWAAWGKALMDLHINYETVDPYNLIEHKYEVKAEAKRQKEMFSLVEEPEALLTRKPKVKVKLKADKTAGIIDIDELTFLSGVPAEAWQYKLGNRSALEWILDQYKEKKPGDPTIAEKFDTYRFADYKEKVIDLLKRVCTVSVETVKIIKQMELDK
ncbi:MAG: type ISP restriction/modification enzyme, partial [Bacteroidota bacterium]